MLTEKPTPRTHPDILREYRAGSPYWVDDFFEKSTQRFRIDSPRDFDTAMAINYKINHNIVRVTQDESNHSIKKPLRKFLGCLGIMVSLVLCGTISLFVAYEGAHIAEAVAGDSVTNDFSAVLILLGTIITALGVAISGYIPITKCLDIIETDDFHPMREPYFTVIATDYGIVEKLGLHRSQHKVAVALRNIITMSEENLDTVDLHAFAHAYDEYMDMFAFVLANRDELSPALIDEYVASLDAKANIVAEEAQVIDTVIDSRKKFLQEMDAESQHIQQIQQEFTDLRARTMMPPEV